MQNQTCSSTIWLSRPFPDRLFDALTDTLSSLKTAWRRRQQRRRVEREIDAVADMNELLLRDIGAPEWMISQAAVRRDLDRQRVLEVHQGVRFDH